MGRNTPDTSDRAGQSPLDILLSRFSRRARQTQQGSAQPTPPAAESSVPRAGAPLSAPGGVAAGAGEGAAGQPPQASGPGAPTVASATSASMGTVAPVSSAGPGQPAAVPLYSVKDYIDRAREVCGVEAIEVVEPPSEPPGPIPNGRYHAVLESVERDETGASPYFRLVFRLLAGGDGQQAGRMVYERVYNTEKSRPRLRWFAFCLGLLRKADLGQPGVRRSWREAVGQQVVVEVVTETTNKGKRYERSESRLTFGGIWLIDAPEAALVPKDREALVRQAARDQEAQARAERLKTLDADFQAL